MNFLAIRNTQEKTDVELQATLAQVLKTGNTKSGSPVTTVLVVDNQGEQQNVDLYNKTPIGQFLGQCVPFKLRWYRGRNGMGYSGFLQDRGLTPQQPAYPTPMKAPPQQAAPPTQHTDMEKIRTFACGNAARIVANMGITDPDLAAHTTICIASSLASWIASEPPETEVPF